MLESDESVRDDDRRGFLSSASSWLMLGGLTARLQAGL